MALSSKADGSSYNYDTEFGSEAGPSKEAKLTYKSSFSVDWMKTWAYITPVPDNPHSFRCTIYNKKLSYAHQGVYNESHVHGLMIIVAVRLAGLKQQSALVSLLLYIKNKNVICDHINIKIYGKQYE